MVHSAFAHRLQLFSIPPFHHSIIPVPHSQIGPFVGQLPISSVFTRMELVVNGLQSKGLDSDFVQRQRSEPTQERRELAGRFDRGVPLLIHLDRELAVEFIRDVRERAVQFGMDAVPAAQLGHDLGVYQLTSSQNNNAVARLLHFGQHV